MRAILSCTVELLFKMPTHLQRQQTHIHLKLMSEDEIEQSLKQTNARVYWDDLLAV